MSDFKIVLYAVPYSKNINSGPMVRISSIKKEIEKHDKSLIIIGDGLSKIKLAIQMKSNNILYIESSTNRIKFADFISLLLLKLKSKKVIVYIRDVYVELFPEEYVGSRNKVTAFFNKWTNKFYGLIATDFAFPTYEMGDVFFKKNNIRKRTMIELPPACDDVVTKANEAVSTKRLDNIKLIYIGGINYRYSGIENFINLIINSPDNYRFYIVTYDSSINNYLSKLNTSQLEKVQLLSMNKEQVADFIQKENVTYMFHSRPINEYDSLTYPIKFFDALTWNLPTLTAKNFPVVKILGNSYPLYVEVDNPENICKIIASNNNNYYSTLCEIEKIAIENRYQYRVQAILKPDVL